MLINSTPSNYEQLIDALDRISKSEQEDARPDSCKLKNNIFMKGSTVLSYELSVKRDGGRPMKKTVTFNSRISNSI